MFNGRDMDEVINDIMQYIKKKCGDFSYPDQALMYNELESKMADLNADALKAEYLGSNTDIYILDSI